MIKRFNSDPEIDSDNNNQNEDEEENFYDNDQN